jgi:hypothetical protein
MVHDQKLKSKTYPVTVHCRRVICGPLNSHRSFPINPISETGNVNTLFCLNVPIERQILQRCASLGFGEPFCNICEGESPRNKVDACWSRLVQNLSLNPVPHHSNRGAFYVYMLPISVEGKSKEIFINFMSRRQDAGKVPLTRPPDTVDMSTVINPDVTEVKAVSWHSVVPN